MEQTEPLDEKQLQQSLLKTINLDTIENLPPELLAADDLSVIVDDKNRTTYSILRKEVFHEGKPILQLWRKKGGRDSDKIPYIYVDNPNPRKVYFHPRTGKKLLDTEKREKVIQILKDYGYEEVLIGGNDPNDPACWSRWCRSQEGSVSREKSLENLGKILIEKGFRIAYGLDASKYQYMEVNYDKENRIAVY